MYAAPSENQIHLQRPALLTIIPNEAPKDWEYSYLLSNPTKRTDMVQGLFLRWVQTQANTHPVVPKILWGPISIPLKTGTSGANW